MCKIHSFSIKKKTLRQETVTYSLIIKHIQLNQPENDRVDKNHQEEYSKGFYDFKKKAL